ncbi:MAG: HEAT repeat domain-containing protein [Alphaproteobacteria bacterium]|nr:MAG: HEAT repeat domain-containing protein [Alphaproteobacteria bacterium]
MRNPAQSFEHWLADPAARRTTQRRVDACAARWGRGPVHARFDAAMAALPCETAEAIADAMLGLFSDGAWLDTLIGSLSAELSVDPFFEPPFPPLATEVHHGLIVFEDPRLTIAAGVMAIGALAARKSRPRGATSVGLSGRMSVFKFLNAGDARISLWEAPQVGADFSAASAGSCVRTGERRLADGDVLIIDGRRQSYVVEHARSSLLILQAEIMLDQAPVSVEFDSATGLYVGCSANGDGASRIQMLTTLLRKLEAPQAFAAIAGFLDHEDFFVRWHAMRELLGIDLAAALPRLRAMAAGDPHPEPRRAAGALIERIEAGNSRKAA